MNDVRPASPQSVAPLQPRPMQPPTGIRPLASPAVRPTLIAPPTPIPSIAETSSLELVDEAGEEARKSKIHNFSVAAVNHSTHQWKRQPHHTDNGAIRVRTFHGRLSDQGLEYMDNAINDWLDRNPDIELKNVTSTVGLFDGKIKEPALILNLWY
jgi:hypothetical protein